MKKILLTIVFMITTFVSNAQSDSLKGSYYSLKGKIINKIQLTPPCGVIAWGTVIELEILEFTDSSYHDKEIAVIFTCPEFYKENFLQVGQTYALKLSDKNPANFGWTIPNLDILKSYKTSYWPWVIDAQKNKMTANNIGFGASLCVLAFAKINSYLSIARPQGRFN